MSNNTFVICMQSISSISFIYKKTFPVLIRILRRQLQWLKNPECIFETFTPFTTGTIIVCSWILEHITDITYDMDELCPQGVLDILKRTINFLWKIRKKI